MSQPLKDLNMYLGNDWRQRFQVKGSDQSIINISGYGIVFTINDIYDENPLSATIQKANVTGGGSGTEINMGSAVNGIYEPIITDTDQSSINSGNYHYDIKFIIGGLEYTQKVGVFRINKVVNRF